MTAGKLERNAADQQAFAPDATLDPEAVSALYQLPRGRWRSLGKHFDYANWLDRDRFMQLDHAIEAEQLRELN